MIPIDNTHLYARSLEVLRQTVGSKYLGRLVQMFLACKHYGPLIPRIGDPLGIPSGEFESLLDDLYRKLSRVEPEKILMLFKNSYKVPSGVVDGGLKSASNIWRNNLNFQKGYMCYGSATELNAAAFRNQSRTMCPHLQPVQAHVLNGATCALRGGAYYRNEDHPKVFRKSPDDGRYSVYNPADEAFYRSIVLPAPGVKLPIVALIIALYFDSILAAGRRTVSIADFAADFDMSASEMRTYFEDDPASVAHAQLRAINPALSWDVYIPVQAPVAEEALPGELPEIPMPKMPAKKAAAANPKALGAKTTAPPQGSQWWNVEQAVRMLLESEGWVVMDVSRLGVGCDIKASKGETLRLIEVKSSVGACAPILTAREYAQAKESRKGYVLAVVENFDPTSELFVQWVHDPAHLQFTRQDVTQYFLPRSVWRKPAASKFPG